MNGYNYEPPRRRQHPPGPPDLNRQSGRPMPNRSAQNVGNRSYDPYRQPNRRSNRQPNRQYDAYGRPYSNRQYAGQYAAPPLTPEERARRAAIARQRQIEAERRRREAEARERRRRAWEKEQRKIRRKQSLKVAGGRIFFFLIVLLLLCLLTGALFLIAFFNTPDKQANVGTITYFYGGQETRRTKISDCVIDGTVFLCFNDLSDYLGLRESGSADAMKFVLPTSDSEPKTSAGDGTEESVLFYPDDRTVSINGQNVDLNGETFLDGTEVWVSTKFVTDYMNNLSLTYDSRKSAVSVARIRDEEASTEKNTVFLPVSFLLKDSSPMSPLPEDPLIGDVTYSDDSDAGITLNFVSDVSQYETYMNPTGNLRDAFLTLVNKTNALSESDIPNDLMDVRFTSTSRSTQQLREYAHQALEALFSEMHALGFYDMAVYSGYRDYAYQSTLFETYTRNEMNSNPALTQAQAEELVLTYASRPGTSEHQTGLAVDMDTMGAFSTDFEYTDEYAWLKDNAWKFGFVLRFPKDKENITTIQFEPWHYRYVGRYHAQKMYASGLCLEEYLEQLKP